MKYPEGAGNGDLENTPLASLRPNHRTKTWVPYRDFDQRLQEAVMTRTLPTRRLARRVFFRHTQLVGLGQHSGVPDCPIGVGSVIKACMEQRGLKTGGVELFRVNRRKKLRHIVFRSESVSKYHFVFFYNLSGL